MRFTRIALGAVAIGVLAILAIVLFGPRNAASLPQAGSGGPTPILQPITPSGYPYSSLAILRSPRLSTDVLPAAIGDEREKFLPGTVRHVVTSRSVDGWLAVDAHGEVCFVTTSPGDRGSSSGCSSVPAKTPAPGSVVMGYGAGDHFSFFLVVDGTPRAGAIAAGYHQILPNVWFKGRGHVVERPRVADDPFAFPLQKPYSSFAILRQPRTEADAPPDFLTDSSADAFETLRLDQLHFAGSFHKTRAWVTVDVKGRVCLIASNEATGFTCASPREVAEHEDSVSIGVQDVYVELQADGSHPDSAGGKPTRIGPNLWATLIS